MQLALQGQTIALQPLQARAGLGQVDLFLPQLVAGNVILIGQRLVALARVFGITNANFLFFDLSGDGADFRFDGFCAAPQPRVFFFLHALGAFHLLLQRGAPLVGLACDIALQFAGVVARPVAVEHVEHLPLLDHFTIDHVLFQHHTGLRGVDPNQAGRGHQLAVDGDAPGVAAQGHKGHHRSRKQQRRHTDPHDGQLGCQHDFAQQLGALVFQRFVSEQAFGGAFRGGHGRWCLSGDM